MNKLLTVTYKITSSNLLLMDNVNSMLLKKPAGIKADEWSQSEQHFNSKLYLDEEGKPCIPAWNFIRAITCHSWKMMNTFITMW